jgi:hypothetical protein
MKVLLSLIDADPPLLLYFFAPGVAGKSLAFNWVLVGAVGVEIATI